MVVSVAQCEKNIAVVTIDNPPVNAISLAVRQKLLSVINNTNSDDTVKAVILICAGRTFIAGADVKEFDQSPVPPHLPELLLQIEHASKPWIAAIHGSALGGGLETAMACHHRIINPEVKLGLPEVTLGVIPGAGGTVRLPRLVPPDTALEMIATGKSISAQDAIKVGLADALSSGDLLADAIALARKAPMPNGLLNQPLKETVFSGKLETAAAKILSKSTGQNAPRAAVNVLRNAYTLPPKEALKIERETFLSLRADQQSSALRHIFFAERATTKIGRIKNIEPRTLLKIGIIGGGTMGAGITAACLLAGYQVQTIELNTEAAEDSKSRVLSILNDSNKRGLISTKKHQQLTQNFAISARYDDLGDADLIIEAVFEDMSIKKQVFAQLEIAAKPNAILATNTSYLDVNEIATSIANPDRVVGLHFFSPAYIMKLIEVVEQDHTQAETLATVISFAKTLGKIPVIVGVCDGFVANRIMSAYRCEAEYLIEDGAMPWDVDNAMVEFGFPMGIFQMGDLAGLDISWAMRKQKALTRNLNERYVDVGDKLCELGRLGRKTGRGYYKYEKGSRGTPDPEVETLILAESRRKGITRSSFSSEQIMSRILNTMQREGKKILEEGFAEKAEDIDVIIVNAFGFPRWRGGPMYMLSNPN